MNVFDILDSTVGVVIRAVVGESAAQKIARKRAEAERVLARTSTQIEQTIATELDVLRHTAQVAFGRIDALIGTNALAGAKATATAAAKRDIESALKRLEAAI